MPCRGNSVVPRGEASEGRRFLLQRDLYPMKAVSRTDHASEVLRASGGRVPFAVSSFVGDYEHSVLRIAT